MQFRQLTLAAAAALCLAGAAHATVVNFDNPGLIDIDNDTFVATYTESGYQIQGQAADFLLLDNGAGNGFLVGGFFGAVPFSLMAAAGGAFSLLGFDLASYDLGDTPGTLTVSGVLDGAQVATGTFSLGAPSAAVRTRRARRRARSRAVSARASRGGSWCSRWRSPGPDHTTPGCPPCRRVRMTRAPG